MAFVWNSSFDTGIAIVDQQHHGLVDLINEVAPLLSDAVVPPVATIERLLDRLFAYAATHFKTEEELMKARQVDSRHVLLHGAEHAHFVDQLIALRVLLADGPDPGANAKLLAFLIHWLGFHILDVDQRMATQMRLIASGQPPAVAYENSFGARANDASRQALVAALVDIYSVLAERRKAAEEARRMTSFDLLTGLPNRTPFLAALGEAAAEAQSGHHLLALLVVDVDGLSAINQSAGHETADRLLAAIGERLRTGARRLDLSARTGNDEFALALVGGADHDAVLEVAKRMYQDLSLPVFIDGHAVDFSLSGGLALLPDDAADAEHLLAAAEMAQAAAKHEGGGSCRRFDLDLGPPGVVRSDAVRALRDAIGNNELVLHYQPQVSLHSGEIVGLEALVRWAHPTRGLVPPGLFIPLAEESGLVIPLGDWVIRSALAQCQAWREQGLPEVRVAVNLSARHFRHSGLAEMLEALLHQHGVSPHLFELELTESVMMRDPAGAIRVVERLKQIGVKLSLDDFGTGYSSLSYLSRFAIDSLKIDQSFVADITTNPINASISVATIAMAHKLGKNVIAEGVETEAQMAYLRRHDCDEMQGFLFARPMPPDAIGEMLRAGKKQSFGISDGDLPCLLLVDDEANILNALKRLLRREGYRILLADSGAQGLELLAANAVQVIVSDQRMPEMTGTEFLSRVKELYPDTVRMVLSGYSELASVTEAVNRGAIYKYLSKPWQDEELKREIFMAFRHYKEGKC